MGSLPGLRSCSSSLFAQNEIILLTPLLRSDKIPLGRRFVEKIMIIGFSTIAFIPKRSQKMKGYVKQDNGRNQRKEEKFTKKNKCI
jgi:hypothetical protein